MLRRLMWVGVGGCGGWPLWAHLPEDEPTIPADVDPRALVEVAWSPIASEEAPQPPGQPVTLGDVGALISGRLQGVGWSDLAIPTVITGAACGSQGTRAPLEGDWIGGVAVFDVEVDADGRLCARVTAGDAETGLDMIAWAVDECGVPSSLLADEAGPVGLYGAGPAHGWAMPVSAGQRLAIVLAAYAPNDLDRAIDYSLGLVVRPADDPLCPLLPGEDAP